MKTLILHIGYSKSGSTTIQQFLKKNRKELLDFDGIYYPLEKREGFECSYNFFSVAQNGTKEELLELVSTYFKKSDTVIISSEYIAGLHDAAYYQH